MSLNSLPVSISLRDNKKGYFFCFALKLTTESRMTFLHKIQTPGFEKKGYN